MRARGYLNEPEMTAQAFLPISEIVRERRGISAETALRLARFFGTTPRFWMNLQASYDTKIAYQSHRDSIAQIRPAEPLLQS